MVRDPNKCILCGDCVRVCSEVQAVGVIDFAHRGSKAMVLPCFGKNLDGVECVYCGQCARVCPTGALTPKSEIESVWKAVNDKDVLVVAQIAPAVRVALGELFGLSAGTTSTGQIVTALKMMGFDKVYDTSFTADLTVIEESNEFLKRIENGGKIPQFTSCCPAWIKYVEQYYPDMLSNLSSCRSPQQMFGSLSKEMLSSSENRPKDKIKVVSIMPCTAKKYEAKRPEFKTDGIVDVDHVITTQELAKMIEETGIMFNKLEPSSFDMPFGFKSGAGVIFGNSGGVMEAVLRYVTEKLTTKKDDKYEFSIVRGDDNFREAELELAGKKLKIAVVNSLGRAKQLIEDIKAGKVHYDFVEVMACPGGCIGGAGQPYTKDTSARRKRTKGLYENDKMLQFHKPQDNPYIHEVYDKHLGEIGGEMAHKLLHTKFKSRRRISDEGVVLTTSKSENKLDVTVCFGTGCFLKGAQKLLRQVLDHISEKDLKEVVEVKASFCFEKCDRGPVVKIGDELIEKATLDDIVKSIEQKIHLGA